MAIVGAKHGMRARGSYNVEVQLSGEWFRFNALVNSLNRNIKIAALAAQHEFAQDYKDALIENIKNGGTRFAYPPHSPQYAKYKAKHGGGGSLMRWSDSLINAIEVLPLSGKLSGVGIPKDAKREEYFGGEGGIKNISEYANINEHGSWGKVNIPPRPYFSDTFRKTMGGLKGLRKHIEVALFIKFKAKGIKVIKL